MNIVFENCEELKIQDCEVSLRPDTEGSFKRIEIKIFCYLKVKNWERLLRRDIAVLELSDEVKINIPYEDEKPGILGSQNKFESVTIDCNCLCITIEADN